MHYTIYKVKNIINNKEYIGMHKTENLNDEYMGSGKLIKLAIKKYGIENFNKKILFIFDNENDMKTKEKQLVTEEYCNREDTYNLCSGGHGGFSYINRTIDRVSLNKNINLKRNYKDEQFRNKISKSVKKLYTEGKKVNWKWRYDWAGRKHTTETKEKIKLALKDKSKGNKNSQYGTHWITNGIENKKVKKEELDFWIQKGYYKGRKIFNK